MRKRQSGFTLVEVLMASFLAGITLTCIIQFFLTQLNQYRLISSSNKINENLRIFSKFVEKDVHNTLCFYVFKDLEEALNFDATKSSIEVPTVGNCVLFVQERGMVNKGRGVIYHVGEATLLNGQECYPLYRALVTFSEDKTIQENADTLINLTVGYLAKPANNEQDDTWEQFFELTNNKNEIITGIFYTNSRKRAGNVLHNSNTKLPYVAGCRRGLFVGTRLIQPGFYGMNAQSLCNFCFFSRNPRF